MKIKYWAAALALFSAIALSGCSSDSKGSANNLTGTNGYYGTRRYDSSYDYSRGNYNTLNGYNYRWGTTNADSNSVTGYMDGNQTGRM